MSLETLCVKTEAEEVCVKEDADMCEDEAGAHVKEEVECEDRSALCELYAGHQVKDELVLGPVDFHRPSVLSSVPAARHLAGGRACSVRLERLPVHAVLGPGAAPRPHTDQARLAYKNEPPKTNKRQARVQEMKESREKRSPVEKLNEPSTSLQVESPMNTDIQEVPPEEPAVNTFTGKTDLTATNFKCDLCGKGFDIKSELKKHIQTHELMKEDADICEDEAGAHIKKEVECEDRSALCELYAGHQVKDELVLGPVEYHRPSVLSSVPAARHLAGGRACSVRLERLPVHAVLGPGAAPRPHTDQARLAYKNEPPKTNKRQARVQEMKESREKRSPVEKLNEPSTSLQVESPMNTDIQEVPPEEPAVNTFTGKTDLTATNFKCDLCGKGFDIKSELKKHIQTHELMKKSKSLKASKDFTCKKCSCTFGTKLLLVQHAKSRHAEVYLTCSEYQARLAYKNEPPKTNKRQARVQEMKESREKRSPVEKLNEPSTSLQVESPMNTVIQEVPPEEPAVNTFTGKTDLTATNFKCDLCGKGFDIKSELKKHIQTHELMKKTKSLKASKDFTCKKCSCTFGTKLLLVQHAKSRHDEVYLTCSECEYMTMMKESLKVHLRTHTGNRPFKCTQCSSAFIQSGSLQRHLRTHTGERPFKCTQCSSAFAVSSSLQRHLRTHTGERPFKCTQCSSAFAQGGHLQTHLRTHTGGLRFKCTQCSSAFIQSGSLQRHLRTHTGERPFKCTQCSSAFAQSGHLQRHLRTHTGERPFKCTQCSSAFARSGTLENHLKTHTGERPLQM